MALNAINRTSENKNRKFILQSFTQDFNPRYPPSKECWPNLATQSRYCYRVRDLLVDLATDNMVLLVRPEINFVNSLC